MGRSQCIVRCFEGVNQALLALGSPWDIVYPVAAGLGNGFAVLVREFTALCAAA